MDIHAITLFPEIFDCLQHGLSGKALKTHSTLTTHQLRDFSERPDRRIDDRPFGGGPGMLISAEPVFRAKQHIRKINPNTRFIFTDPKGQLFSQEHARELANEESLTFICGRYEGIDERVYDNDDLIYSIGDYIMTGGELPACTMIDAILRLIPGTIGNPSSHEHESLTRNRLEHPQYTRPAIWRNIAAPTILLSGNHSDIKKWQHHQQLILTWQKRPDLIDRNCLSDDEKSLIKHFIEEQRHVITD